MSTRETEEHDFVDTTSGPAMMAGNKDTRRSSRALQAKGGRIKPSEAFNPGQHTAYMRYHLARLVHREPERIKNREIEVLSAQDIVMTRRIASLSVSGNPTSV